MAIKSKNGNVNRQTGAAFLLLSPWLLGVLALTVGPMIASAYLSLTSYRLLDPGRWVGLDNYVRLLTADPRYAKSVSVTAFYTLVSVPLKLAFALAVAMLLVRNTRGVGWLRAAYYLPSMLGGSVAIAIMWRLIFGADGAVNQVLGVFGIQGVSWLTSPNTSIWTLIALAVWQFGSPMVIFLAALKQVPVSLYEAATIDGASKWRVFWSITLPMITPVIFFNLILQIIGAFQNFTPSYVVSGGTGGPIDSTLLYSLYLYLEGFVGFRMGYASAMAWLLVGILGVVTGLLFATSRFWVFYGDEK
ncbi:MAG: sugar ABC transporter permease [Hyphomicrobiales bacterium]|nr:MAG: sugar ABC transporter permease [Hyphomicrobiales bacterium]